MLARRTFPGGVIAQIDEGLRSAGFLVAFTERPGGTSDGGFAGLNLGVRSGDDLGRVIENRRLVCRALGIRGFACGHQVHGAVVASVTADDAGAGFEDPASALPGADALVTTEPGVPIAVVTADCVPVALVDLIAGRVAAVHAGWRGMAAGVVTSALEAFDDPGRVRAVVGPAVGPDHYEVGEEVVEALTIAAGGSAAIDRSGSRPRVDLGATAAGILRSSGVRDVEVVDACTACEPSRFYSHRRDGPTGRQALVVARVDGPGRQQ